MNWEALRWFALGVQTGSFVLLATALFALGNPRLAWAQVGLAAVTVLVYAP